MTIDEAIFAYLSTYAGLVSLISTKVYPDIVPQSVSLPAIVYTLISSNKPRSVVCGHHGISNDTYQISAYATTKAGVSAIKEQLKTALLNYHGLMGSLNIQQCVEVGSGGDGYDNQALEYYSHTDYMFSYEY